MKISRDFVLVSLMALASAPVLAAGFNLNDAASAISAIQGGNKNVQAPGATSGLLGALGSQLNVTPQQAVGGTGAMLGLAKNQLSSSDFSQLSQNVPGLDKLAGNNGLGDLGALLSKSSGKSSGLDGLLGNVKTADDLNKSFTALGMDSGMVGQFAPVIIKYLGEHGVGSPLLSSLSGIWGVGG